MSDYLTPQPEPLTGTAQPTWPKAIAECRARAFEHTDKTQSARAWLLVAHDGEARHAEGCKRFGVPHQSDNGRDHAADAYQEALDGVCYWRAESDVAHLHGDEKRATEAWALYQDALRLAHRARLYLLRRDER